MQGCQCVSAGPKELSHVNPKMHLQNSAADDFWKQAEQFLHLSQCFQLFSAIIPAVIIRELTIFLPRRYQSRLLQICWCGKGLRWGAYLFVPWWLLDGRQLNGSLFCRLSVCLCPFVVMDFPLWHSGLGPGLAIRLTHWCQDKRTYCCCNGPRKFCIITKE